jgi:PAS domain S-box-containing protein
MDRAPTDLSHALSEAGHATAGLEKQLAHARLELAEAQDRLARGETRLDIRDRELALLRSSHELLVSTLDATSDGILTLQFSDDSMYYNIRFVELWGIPEDKLCDLDLGSLIEFQLSRVKDPAEWRARIEQRRRDPDAEDLSIVELRDGRVLERHVIPQRIHGQCVGSVITFRDITDRVRYESKMMFNHMVLENSGPMFWLDRDSLVATYANPAACQHLGYSLEELLGKGIADIDLDFTAADFPDLDAALLRSGKPVTFESRHRRKDGTIRNIEVTSFLTEAAERAMYIISVKDITRQKRAEREKRHQ